MTELIVAMLAVCFLGLGLTITAEVKRLASRLDEMNEHLGAIVAALIGPAPRNRHDHERES